VLSEKHGTLNLSKNEKLNGVALASIILISIGIIFYICNSIFRFNFQFGILGLPFERLIGGLFFYGGIILAFISLYKQKNKIILIIGIIAGVFNLFWSLFQTIMFRI